MRFSDHRSSLTCTKLATRIPYTAFVQGEFKEVPRTRFSEGGAMSCRPKMRLPLVLTTINSLGGRDAGGCDGLNASCRMAPGDAIVDHIG